MVWGLWGGGCNRAEVSLLCPSHRFGAPSQAPAMIPMLLLLLLLLHSTAAGRPLPTASPRLKLAFPGEHGPWTGGIWVLQFMSASSQGIGAAWWGLAWREVYKTPAVLLHWHWCCPPCGLPGIGRGCQVPTCYQPHQDHLPALGAVRALELSLCL